MGGFKDHIEMAAHIEEHFNQKGNIESILLRGAMLLRGLKKIDDCLVGKRHY
jgi:hypothetical protein